VFSNHFQTVTAFGVAAESLARVLVDHNAFEADVPMPLTTLYMDSVAGSMTETSNDFPAGVTPDFMLASPPVTVPYSYSYDSAESVPRIVSSCAGTGKISFKM
jgi:pectate lyase